MRRSLTSLLAAVLLTGGLAGCADDDVSGSGGSGGSRDGGLSPDEEVAALVERLEGLDGVASVSGERQELDTDYHGIEIEARMEPDAAAGELAGALAVLDEDGPEISTDEYEAALVVPGDGGADHRLIGIDPSDGPPSDEYADADVRTSWFTAARAALPTAVIEVGAGLRAVVAEPSFEAVTEAASAVADDPLLSQVAAVEVATDGSGNYPLGLHLSTSFGMTADELDVWRGVVAAAGPLDRRRPQDVYVSHREPEGDFPQAWNVTVHLNTLVPDDVPPSPDAGPAGRRLWAFVTPLLDVVKPLDPAALEVTASSIPFLNVATDDSNAGHVDLPGWHRAALDYLRP